MERDFMGLNSRESETIVKEEPKELCKDSVFTRVPGAQWPFANKISAPPHLMSFKSAQEDRLKKTAYDPLSSSGFMTISTADAFDSNLKISSGVFQKGGNHYKMTTYPVPQIDAQFVQRPHDVRTFSFSTMSNPFFKTQTGYVGQNVTGAAAKQQPLGGIPITTPQSTFQTAGSIAGITAGSIAGITDMRAFSKPSGAPAQLTIFYGGMVNVYDDISPERAQAIMLLAGNGSSAANTHSKAQVQAPIPKPVTTSDAVLMNPSHTTPPGSGLSSPISVTSHTGAQPGSGSSSSATDELMAAKSVGSLKTPVSQPEPQKIVSSLGPKTATMMPSAVPQFRNASLARFLEKRKERVMKSAPYNLGKKSPDSTPLGPKDVSLSMNSGAGPGSPSAGNDQSWCMGQSIDKSNNEK